jgi:hypothetical protein
MIAESTGRFGSIQAAAARERLAAMNVTDRSVPAGKRFRHHGRRE